ncbi:FXSXX-COOH protein [Micromonospora sp. M51]|nr:FXSXX-COOH protein [Micromonospora sp. M51]MBQ1030357.1 FXSXX-COOH protein [Micromonospora sp. C97]
MEPTVDDYLSHQLDVSKISLAELREARQGAFVHCLERILDELDRPQDPVAGFTSAI